MKSYEVKDALDGLFAEQVELTKILGSIHCEQKMSETETDRIVKKVLLIASTMTPHELMKYEDVIFKVRKEQFYDTKTGNYVHGSRGFVLTSNHEGFGKLDVYFSCPPDKIAAAPIHHMEKISSSVTIKELYNILTDSVETDKIKKRLKLRKGALLALEELIALAPHLKTMAIMRYDTERFSGRKLILPSEMTIQRVSKHDGSSSNTKVGCITVRSDEVRMFSSDGAETGGWGDQLNVNTLVDIYALTQFRPFLEQSLVMLQDENVVNKVTLGTVEQDVDNRVSVFVLMSKLKDDEGSKRAYIDWGKWTGKEED